MALNAAKSSIPFGRIKRPPKAWWSAGAESAVSGRHKAFSAAHRSDEDCQAYISASRRTSSVIAKAKAEAWQTTCSSLSPKFVHFLLRFIAGSSSCISASSWGPSKESLSLLYKAFLRPLLTYASPGWFPFLSTTNFTKLERLRRSASPAITGCLSPSPIPLLLQGFFTFPTSHPDSFHSFIL